MTKKIWLILFFLLLCAGVTAFTYRKQREEEQSAAQAGQSVVEAGEGQGILYGKISSVIGNEITIEYLDKTEGGKREEFSANGETAEWQIPVGTQVETRLGSMTTFSRLSAGDTVALLVQQGKETEELLKIWIVG